MDAVQRLLKSGAVVTAQDHFAFDDVLNLLLQYCSKISTAVLFYTLLYTTTVKEPISTFATQIQSQY